MRRGGIVSWVLLQPERVNAYAQAVIRTLWEDELQYGWLMEERVLKGDLAYESSMPRLAGDEERFALVAMRQTPVEGGFPSPAERKRIAQRFIAGFPRARGISPVRDERTGSHFAWFLSPLRGLVDSTGSYPPLKRWAIFGRPSRDWGGEGQSYFLPTA